MTNFTQVGVAGDWHGQKGWAKFALNVLAEQGVTQVLHVGDFGFWPGDRGWKFLHDVNKQLVANDQFLDVTPGNHEDYVQLSAFQPTAGGYMVNREFPRIRVSPRGHRWVWNDVSFVSLGGANSIDRNQRVENIDWWAAEQISVGDVYQTCAGGEADIMITHDCPAGVDVFAGVDVSELDPWPERMLEYAQGSRDMLRWAVDVVKPQVLFHGHYHHRVQIDTELTNQRVPEKYLLHSVGIDRDFTLDNLVILNLEDRSYEFVTYDWPDWVMDYQKK